MRRDETLRTEDRTMDFSVSEKLQKLLAKIRQFMEKEIYPLEAAGAENFAAALPELRAKRALVKEMGLWARKSPPHTAAWA